MEYFVDQQSIVRKIWGKSDTILFIFAGAAAEFALNKAVDWLYFTGRLPADPIGRLFSTVDYAKRIVFAEREAALRTIDSIAAIHSAVEARRGERIPDWAYRDVLFMLIDYSIRSFEVLERPLTLAENEEVFQVFRRLGTRMGMEGLPVSFDEWKLMRDQHLQNDLGYSHFTADLFKQYKKHLGIVRYRILLEAQSLVAPPKVKSLLKFRAFSLLRPLVSIYKLSRTLHADWILKEIILPSRYKKQIQALDTNP